MKQISIILIVVLLALIAGMQFLAARGIFSKRESVTVCPVDAISMQNGKAVIDADKCIGCRRCVDPLSIVNQNADGADDKDGIFEHDPESQESAEEIQSSNGTIELKANITQSVPEAYPQTKEILVKQDEDDPEDDISFSHYVVDTEACISCNLCLRVCPAEAISMADGKAYIDPELCINCGTCAGEQPESFRGCPVGAISPAEDSPIV